MKFKSKKKLYFGRQRKNLLIENTGAYTIDSHIFSEIGEYISDVNGETSLRGT